MLPPLGKPQKAIKTVSLAVIKYLGRPYPALVS